jgi:hypothetical protein
MEAFADEQSSVVLLVRLGRLESDAADARSSRKRERRGGRLLVTAFGESRHLAVDRAGGAA